MQTIQVTVTVPKETQELSQGLIKFIRTTKAALDDGFQIGADAAVILGSLMSDLVPAIQGFDQIKDEAQSPEFYNAAALFGVELFKAIKGEQAPQAPQA